MIRPAYFCLCVATLMTIMTIGGTRGASLDSYLASKSMLGVENGNVLRLFFEEMVRVIENGKWHPHHAMIASRFKEDLHIAEPFCKVHSCILGNPLRMFQLPKTFRAHSVIVWFLSSVKFVEPDIMWFENRRSILVFRGSISLDEVTKVFREIEIAKIGHVNIIVEEDSSVKVYAPKPTASCTVETRLIIAWSPGEKILEDALRSSEWSVSYRDCLVTLSTSNQMPSIKVENIGGKITITGGMEGRILMVAAEKMNLNIRVNYLASTNDANISIEQEIVNNVAQGRSDMGIGQIRMTDRIAKNSVTVADSRMVEQVYWCIPRLLTEGNNITLFEFAWPIWILILVVFFLMIRCERVFQSSSRAHLESARRRERGRTDVTIMREGLRNRGNSVIQKNSREWGKLILDVFSMSLGYPVLVEPITVSARILLFTFFYYAMVITTAYKSSLSSMLTTEIDKPLITDVKGILAANLTTGGEIEELEILKDQVNASPVNRELIRRYVVYPTREAVRKRLTVNHDFAYLSLMSDLIYDDKVWTSINAYSQYQILPDRVLTYNSMIVWRPNTVLYIPMERIVLSIFESGLANHWSRTTLNHRIKVALTADAVVNSQNKRGTIAKYERIFVLYAVCMLISSFVFLAELLVHKLARTIDCTHPSLSTHDVFPTKFEGRLFRNIFWRRVTRSSYMDVRGEK